MEDSWHGPEDPTNQEPETTRKKRRGTDFLSQYLLRRREQQGEHVEEDDDEESEEKPKKFKRFFKGLFKRVVESPTDTKEQFPKSFSLESLFLSDQEKLEKSIELDQDNQNQETEALPSQPLETPVAEVTDVPEPLLAERSEEPAEVPMVTTQQERANPVEQTEEQASQPQERAYIEPLVVERAISDDRAIFERAQPQPTTEKEIVIERGPGMALPVVLVGAEYLARKKADRKLDAKYNERVGHIEIENKREKIAKEQLTTLVQQNREQLEALKRDRGIEIARPEWPQPIERSTSRAERQPEQKIQPIKERAQLQPTPEKTETPETYKIMEQVAEAAEHDIPVERVFERSHEVKDDQSVPVGAASIGAIMADQIARQYNTTPRVTKQLPQDMSGLPVIPDHVRTAAYKQAMQRGFWAAIIIIILGTLTYLLK
jgi:hypothetical protein